MQGMKAMYAFTSSYKDIVLRKKTMQSSSQTSAPVSTTINILKTNPYSTKTSVPEILQIKWSV